MKRYKPLFNESQNISVTLYHVTEDKNIPLISSKGLLPSKGSFGKAIYVTPDKERYSEFGNTVYEVIIKNSTNLYDGFNTKTAFADFEKFLNENKLNKNNVDDYFLKLGYDGLNLLKFDWERQVVLYNAKKIVRIKLIENEKI